MEASRCPLQPSTLNPRPSTLNPRPSTLNPQPSNLKPQPSTLKPQTSTLNPQPSTLKVWDAGAKRMTWEEETDAEFPAVLSLSPRHAPESGPLMT